MKEEAERNDFILLLLSFSSIPLIFSISANEIQNEDLLTV
jgi:hypothetical protein